MLRSMVRQYWGRVHAEAFRRASANVIGAAINVVAALVTIVFVAWGLAAWASDDAARDAIIERLLIAGGSSLILAIQYLYYMWSIPAEWADKADKRIVALEAERKPKLSVYLARTSGEDIFRTGTAESFTGYRQSTMMPGPANALSIVVCNDSDIRIDRCIAELISAEGVEGEKTGIIPMIEPIALPWAITNSENNLSTSLEGRAQKRVWIAHVTYKGFVWVARDVSKLPGGYQQIFGPSGKYHATIRISDGEAAPTQVKVEIYGGEGRFSKTYPSGSGQGSIAILEQQSPHLSPLNIEEGTQQKNHPG